MEKKKVLVIDDDQAVLDSIIKILIDKDYDVDVTLRGREGLDWAIQKDYDIVLCDILMPDIGGMRVLRDIKRIKPSIAVVMITGYAKLQSAIQAMKLGAADYLEKPFTPQELLKTIATALDIATTEKPEKQRFIHKEEMIRVLERTSSDSEFIANLLHYGVAALEEYDLTGPEKLALLTGAIDWIEEEIGPLTPSQRRWLESRRRAGQIW